MEQIEFFLKTISKKILFILLFFSAVVPSVMQASLPNWAALKNGAVKITSFLTKHEIAVGAIVVIAFVWMWKKLKEVKKKLKESKEAKKREPKKLEEVKKIKLNAKLVKAAKNGDLKAVVSLFETENIDINWKDDFGDTALITAAWRGSLEVVEFLLKHNADTSQKNECNNTALITAIHNRHLGVIKLLLPTENIGISWENHDGGRTLLAAVQSARPEFVKLLFKGKVSVDQESMGQALIAAVEEGIPDIVKLLLLEKEIDINQQDDYGITALMTASLKSHSERVELLLARNETNVNLKTDDALTSLEIAAIFENK